MESNKSNSKKTYPKRETNTRKYGTTESRNNESTETRTFNGVLRPLMTEEKKSNAQILELSYDFSCRIIRLYKYLNEGKLNKADRDIVDALGRQLLKSATSINANLNEAQHPQSDADLTDGRPLSRLGRVKASFGFTLAAPSVTFLMQQ